MSPRLGGGAGTRRAMPSPYALSGTRPQRRCNIFVTHAEPRSGATTGPTHRGPGRFRAEGRLEMPHHQDGGEQQQAEIQHHVEREIGFWRRRQTFHWGRVAPILPHPRHFVGCSRGRGIAVGLTRGQNLSCIKILRRYKPSGYVDSRRPITVSAPGAASAGTSRRCSRRRPEWWCARTLPTGSTP
jgi:hypothetical protein